MSSDLAGPGSIDEYTASLVEKLHEFQQQDRARIAAFQELAYRYAYISKKYQEDCLATSQWQDRLKEYQDRVRSLEICIVCIFLPLWA